MILKESIFKKKIQIALKGKNSLKTYSLQNSYIYNYNAVYTNQCWVRRQI